MTKNSSSHPVRQKFASKSYLNGLNKDRENIFSDWHQVGKDIESIIDIPNYPEISFSKTHIVSAKGFVKVMRSKNKTITKTRFIRPKIGSKSLGKFLVKFHR
ncbi:hypothetical protein ACFSTE_04010 [Aquimarina hainanensis]|uniref:Uncharacterized protein n=1 Tax=Aquimarina hainanensis TaxID=1578017 RepID=A0ABW5N5E7_9FLAO